MSAQPTASVSAVACVVADHPLPPAAYRERLVQLPQLVHVSVEVNRCPMSHEER